MVKSNYRMDRCKILDCTNILHFILMKQFILKRKERLNCLYGTGTYKTRTNHASLLPAIKTSRTYKVYTYHNGSYKL